MNDQAVENERKQRRRLVDRRSGQDRRQLYSIDYFSSGGPERRISGERRGIHERRAGWIRVGEWTSIRFDDARLPLDDDIQIY